MKIESSKLEQKRYLANYKDPEGKSTNIPCVLRLEESYRIHGVEADPSSPFCGCRKSVRLDETIV